MPPATAETKEILDSSQTIPEEFQATFESIQSLPETREQPGQARAANVAEMSGDSECKAAATANLRARKTGDVALGSTVEARGKSIRNVKEGVKLAAAGNEEGIKMLDGNIVKEMSEYLYKAGNVSTVKLGVDSQGRILRHGQLMQDVYRNGYQFASAHPVIEKRSKAEANNGARIEHLNKQGTLDTHTMVVFSRTPDNMSDEELDDLNFFSATKSLSIQATGKGSEGLQTESAFVAGIPEDGAKRTDKEIVETIFEYFGVDCRGKTAEELVDMPLLIPNEYMENGVIDIVKLYDDINGGTFYGQNVDRQDYLEHKEFCAQRERNFERDKLAVRQQLIAEHGKLNNERAVSKRLAKIVQDKLVKMAIEDDRIDARVFGAESAQHINHVRVLSGRGDYELAMQHAQLATSTASGGSCPASLESLAKMLGLETDDAQSEKERQSWHGGKTKKGTCVNCNQDKTVGVKNWCKNCINC